MKSVEEHGEIVEEYIQKERKAGSLLGPFKPSSHPEARLE